jgi:hypothetical protein
MQGLYLVFGREDLIENGKWYMKDRIELFIERGCKTCGRVLARLLAYARDRGVELEVYDRETHRHQFERRQVVICPATFVNDRLVSYGDCSPDILGRYLARVDPCDDIPGSGSAGRKI